MICIYDTQTHGEAHSIGAFRIQDRDVVRILLVEGLIDGLELVGCDILREPYGSHVLSKPTCHLLAILAPTSAQHDATAVLHGHLITAASGWRCQGTDR